MKVAGYMIVWSEMMQTWIARGATGMHTFPTFQDAKDFAESKKNA